MFSRLPSPSSLISGILLILGIVSFFQGFFFTSRAAGAGSGWTAAILWFSLGAVCFLALSVLSRNRWVIVGFGVIAFTTSLVFATNVFQAEFVLISAAILFLGWRKIRADMDSRIRLSISRSLAAGVFALSVSLSLVLSSQYYFAIRDISWEELVPKFSLSQGGGDAVLRVMGYFSPELRVMRDGNMTVDAFLESIHKSVGSSGDGMVASESMKNEWALLSSKMREELFTEAEAEFITTGRGQLSELTGRSVSGEERMIDVFSEALRYKIVAFLASKKAKSNVPAGALPFFLALLFFITAISIASFLHWIWVFLAAIFIRLLVRGGVLAIRHVPVEQEVLGDKETPRAPQEIGTQA